MTQPAEEQKFEQRSVSEIREGKEMTKPELKEQTGSETDEKKNNYRFNNRIYDFKSKSSLRFK